jgi:hypothetical protein
MQLDVSSFSNAQPPRGWLKDGGAVDLGHSKITVTVGYFVLRMLDRSWMEILRKSPFGIRGGD